jgi:type IV pilus assembly protein PilM
MASGAVWGIDIGQCALKAIRCRADEDGERVVADAFDYIEYPKILSQPGSDPAELIGEALKQFLSRNSVVGDRVAVSASGQAGLARFIKLPPVEAKKIPDIVRYEARQQIPFDLNDVIWDYQRMGGGSEEEGFALETEVGLFAMKRDAVFRVLEPFRKAGIEVDIVQLTPEVLYNFLRFDQLGVLPSAEEYDPETPPESVVVVSLGTDATDLVISNGFRVWQRSIPLGGSHFTKALTKELKLTFAKAEHLKRNAATAADPKALFQAMKVVFNDLLTELQRSLSFFSNLDRSAKIGRIIALGNAIKLPGLRRFLSQHLGYEIEKMDAFRKLTGAQVVSAPSFRENLLSFGVAYGLALQGLGKGAVHTNLLPKEITLDRLIDRKKPWAVAAAAAILLGCSISFATYSLALGKVDVDRWKAAETQATQLKSTADRLKTDCDQAKKEFQDTNEIGQHLVGNVEGRIRWLELLKAVNECLPTDPPRKPDEHPLSNAERTDRITESNELHVTELECQWLDDVSKWYAAVKQDDEKTPEAASTAPGGPPAAGPAAAGPATAPDAGAGGAQPPTGPGWIIQLRGHHFHNANRHDAVRGAEYVRKTLIEKLRTGKVKFAGDSKGGAELLTMRDLGISCPVLVKPLKPAAVDLPLPTAQTGSGASTAAPEAKSGSGGTVDVPHPVHSTGDDAPRTVTVQQFDFDVQFCWQPKTPTERREAKKGKDQTAAPVAQR